MTMSEELDKLRARNAELLSALKLTHARLADLHAAIRDQDLLSFFSPDESLGAYGVDLMRDASTAIVAARAAIGRES
jgi:hypothetical protein